MKYYSIGKFAKEIGVTIQTVRNWDKDGTLKSRIKNESGYRYYSQEQIDQYLKGGNTSDEPVWNPLDFGSKNIDTVVVTYNIKPSVDKLNESDNANYEVRDSSIFARGYTLKNKHIFFDRKGNFKIVENDETNPQKMYNVPIFIVGSVDNNPARMVPMNPLKIPGYTTEYFDVKLMTIESFVNSLGDSDSFNVINSIIDIMNNN